MGLAPNKKSLFIFFREKLIILFTACIENGIYVCIQSPEGVFLNALVELKSFLPFFIFFFLNIICSVNVCVFLTSNTMAI